MNLTYTLPYYIRDILDLADAAGFEAFVVGGAVRDMVLGDTPHDYDLASSATPDELIALFEKKGIRYVDMAAKHGTVSAILPEGNVEITTFRSDGEYKDARHPEGVTFTRSIEEDVLRRDLTINSLYIDKDGNIKDLTGGLKDLDEGIIRCVGCPEVRFEEDALRIMRAIRFEALLGFEIEPATKKAMADKSAKLKLISKERIRSEFIYMLRCPYASKAIRDNVDILSLILPELKQMQGFDQKSKYHDLDMLEHTLKVLDGIPLAAEGEAARALRDEELAAAALFHDTGKPACFHIDKNGRGHMKHHPEVSSEITETVLTSLKCPKEFISHVTELVRLHDTFVTPVRSDVHRFMAGRDEEFLAKLSILQRADINAHSEYGRSRMARLEQRRAIEQQLRDEGCAFSVSELNINGKDLIELGIKEGPGVGTILSALFDLYLQGQVSNDRNELVNKAQKMI